MRLIIILFFVFSSSLLFAHQTKPTIVDIQFKKNATMLMHIQTNIEALVAGIGAEHKDTDDAPQAQRYKQLRELSPIDLRSLFIQFEPEYRLGLELNLFNDLNKEKQETKNVDWQFSHVEIPDVGDTRVSRMSDIYYTANMTTNMTTAIWRYHKKYGDSVIRFSTEGQEVKTTYWLKNGDRSKVYPLAKEVVPQSRYKIAWQYTVLGFEHILPKGIDHILFVLGLFFLSLKMAPLLWQVTAFTIAHSITLGMSMYGLISLSPTIVEPLIALSIAYVGIENMVTKQLKPWRVVIVFLFGLLHGMGFASVLTDLGLPESEFLTALITFNVGVELGQLSVILGAFILVGWLSRKPQLYRFAVIIPGSLSIALMGLYWTFERIVY